MADAVALPSAHVLKMLIGEEIATVGMESIERSLNLPDQSLEKHRVDIKYVLDEYLNELSTGDATIDTPASKRARSVPASVAAGFGSGSSGGAVLAVPAAAVPAPAPTLTNPDAPTRNPDGSLGWDLGGPNKQVRVTAFKGQVYVDIREFYKAGDEYKHTKKGCTLRPNVWRRLVELVPHIEKELTKMEKD